jgi:hypothetical protein
VIRLWAGAVVLVLGMLEAACAGTGVESDHSALADARACLAVIQKMASAEEETP